MGLVIFCFSSVLSNSIEGNRSEDSLTDVSVKEAKICIICVTTDQSEEEEEPNPSEIGSINPDAATSNLERRQKWKKKWLHRREKNRFIDHHHHHHHHHHRWSKKAKRIEERKNRLANGNKKFYSKIQYKERSSHTDQLNDAMDKMLTLFSQTLNNGNSTFHLRLSKPQEDMKIVPWMFVQLDSSAVSGEKRITGGSENANKLETPEVETDNDVDDNEDDVNAEGDSKVSTDMEEESQTSAEVSNAKEGANKSADDDDDDDDDEEDAVSETSANVSCVENNNSKRFNLISKPSPVMLPDGATEYYVKLLSQQEIQCTNGSSVEPSTGLSKVEGKDQKMSRKQRRAHARRYSRKTFTRVEGVELIERSGDVMTGSRENSSVHVVDVQLQIGPLTFVIEKKAAYPFKKSRVAFPALMARLRLKVLDGQLMSARFKPKKIQPSEAVVSLQLGQDDELPGTEQVVARLVGYLSQETTNAWNTGYLLRRLKGRFKQLYIGKTAHKKIDFTNEDAKVLVKLLLESTSDQKQPSTEHPLTDAPAQNFQNSEVLSEISTSRPLIQ